MAKFDFGNLIKGAIYGAILTVPVLLGVILRLNQVQGYTIWFLFVLAEVVAATVVYLQLKRAFAAPGTKKEAAKTSDTQSSKESKSEKKDAAANIAPGDKKAEVPLETKEK